MKKSVLLILILVSSQVFGQINRRNRGYQSRRTPPPQQAKPVKFNSQDNAGAILYDLAEVFKKTKIKPESDQGKKARKYLSRFNDSIENIQIMYRTTFREIDVVVESRMKQMRNSQDIEAMNAFRKYLKEQLDPIRDMVKKIDENLGIALKENLDEKTYKKWLKYEKRKKTQQLSQGGRRR